jgi:hypothetical protein
MPNTKAYQTEEEMLEQDLAEGHIDLKEYNKRMNDLQRDYREEVHKEAQAAYDNVMNQY